jgi:hypothetical protein
MRYAKALSGHSPTGLIEVTAGSLQLAVEGGEGNPSIFLSSPSTSGRPG